MIYDILNKHGYYRTEDQEKKGRKPWSLLFSNVNGNRVDYYESGWAYYSKYEMIEGEGIAMLDRLLSEPEPNGESLETLQEL